MSIERRRSSKSRSGRFGTCRSSSPGATPPKHAYLTANIVWQASEFNLARSLVADWERREPWEINTHHQRSQIDRSDGHFTRAIRETERILKRRSADPVA